MNETSTQKLRVASCQFPVTEDIAKNARYIRRYMRKATEGHADLLHTSEACLSGYAGTDFPTFDGYDWHLLRRETTRLRKLAANLGVWLVLGSAHFLDEHTKPTNCLYIINPRGEIVDRYDKCMCTKGDQKAYSAGQRLVVQTIKGVTIGFAICYDICYPQIYAAYRERGVTLMLHSFYNARSNGPNCLDVLNVPGAHTLRRQPDVGRGQQLVTPLLALGQFRRAPGRHHRAATEEKRRRHPVPRVPGWAIRRWMDSQPYPDATGPE